MILIVAIALHSLSPVILSRISAIVFIYAGVLAFNTFDIQAIGSGIGIYSGLFQVSTVSQLFDIFLFFIAGLILIASPYLNINMAACHSVEAEKIVSNNNSGQYSLIVLFSTLGASLLISSFDLISLYLCIELQSFGVYILATLYRNSESATSAGLKYFLLGSLSSCLILLGTGLVYAYTGLTNLESIYSLVSVSNSTSITQGLNLGIIIIIIGLLFKISAAPFHNWAPDVYDDSPTIVTIWLTIMPKISIVIFLLELYTQLESFGSVLSVGTVIDTLNSGYVLKNILLLSSLLSLIIGTIVGLAQSKIKRLLAYSTISHVGFMLLAIAINTEQSIDSLLFYIIQYSLTNLDTFLIIIALGYLINSSKLPTLDINNRGKELDIKFISELKGQFFSNPLLSVSLTICLFSMAGIPPLLGFFSKQFVLYSAIQSGYYFMSIVCIIVSVISASYYLKIIKVLHSENSNILSFGSAGTQTHQTEKVEANENTILSNLHSFLISTLTLSILFFIFKPS